MGKGPEVGLWGGLQITSGYHCTFSLWACSWDGKERFYSCLLELRSAGLMERDRAEGSQEIFFKLHMGLFDIFFFCT